MRKKDEEDELLEKEMIRNGDIKNISFYSQVLKSIYF